MGEASGGGRDGQIDADETEAVLRRQSIHQLLQIRHRFVRAHDENPIAQKQDGQKQIADDQIAGPKEEMTEDVEGIADVVDGLVQRNREMKLHVRCLHKGWKLYEINAFIT